MKSDLIAHSATIMATRDVAASINFYVKKLRFKLNFSWEDPPSYAVLKRGSTSIHLAERNLVQLSDGPIIYIFCNDVELIYEEYLSNKVIIIEPLSSPTDYGMREFMIIDNNGHRLVFGSGS